MLTLVAPLHALLRKFFNALVSPDEESPARIMKVLHDKRTMRKLLQVVRLLNDELGDIVDHVLTQGEYYLVCCTSKPLLFICFDILSCWPSRFFLLNSL